MQSAHLNHPVPYSVRFPWSRLLSPTVAREYLSRLWRTHRERQSLAELDQRLLRDIGVDPILASYETQRPFWQLSEHHAAALHRWLDSREAA